MATTQQEPQPPPQQPSPTELRASELSRWLQHKHDGTSTYIKKDLVDAGLREKDRMFIWTDGSTFANSRTLVNHILAHSPETIDDLHASSLAMQKVLKSGSGIPRQPQTLLKPKLKRPADPAAQRKAAAPRKKMSLSGPYQAAAAAAAAAAYDAVIPGLPCIHAPASPAARQNPDQTPSKAGFVEKLLSGEYLSDRESTRGTIGLVLEGLESSPAGLNISCLKQLVQQHKVQGELRSRAALLVEDYERAVEVGAARTLSGLQSAAGPGGGGEAEGRSDEDLRQDIEALSELLASNHKFTPAYLASLEKQKAGLEEELAQRGEQVKSEADFKLQRTGLIEEVKDLLLAEDKHLEEVIVAAAGLRKLLEYL